MQGRSEKTAREAVERFKKLPWRKAGVVLYYLDSEASDLRSLLSQADFDELHPRALLVGRMWDVHLTVNLVERKFDAKLLTAAEVYKNQGPDVVRQMVSEDWSMRRRGIERAVRGLLPEGARTEYVRRGRAHGSFGPFLAGYLEECAKTLTAEERTRFDEAVSLCLGSGDISDKIDKGPFWPPMARARFLRDTTLNEATRSSIADELVGYRSSHFFPGAVQTNDIAKLLADRDPRVRQYIALAIVQHGEDGNHDRKKLLEEVTNAMASAETPLVRYEALCLMEKLLRKRLDFDPFSDADVRKEYVGRLKEEVLPKEPR